MPILETDIKLLKSARMTDTPDGGGRMTAEVVQSGVDNNIFDDVSNLDRVYGNVSLRKVFGAVLTNTTDKYLGARVFIDKSPEDENIHGLIFDASSLFDTRSQTSVKVESYLAPGAFYQGLLYGNHLAGMATVMFIQQVDRQLPTVGGVLLLRKNEGLSSEYDQYVKITSVSSAVQKFTDAGGDFERAIVTCGISDSLREAFPGFQAARIDTNLDYTGKTRVFDTVVADASQYYGIRPLDNVATAGDFSVKADTAYSQLLPSAQIETPIADARSNGLSNSLVAAGVPFTQTLVSAFDTTTRLFIGGAVLPSSLTIVGGGVTLTDDAGVLKNGGSDVGSVDYENGICALSIDVFGTPILDVTYTPAAVAPFVSQSYGRTVDIANRSLSYVTTIAALPAPGSLSISYRAGGAWYVLRDNGAGGVVGASSALGAGSINYDTGTLAVTFGALPDVGSALVVQWAEKLVATQTGNTDILGSGKFYVPINSDGLVGEIPGSTTFTPGTVLVTWDDGGMKTASDNSNGGLTGDATGRIDYARGIVYVSPNVLPPVGTVFTVAKSTFAASNVISISETGGNIGANVKPFSVQFNLQIEINRLTDLPNFNTPEPAQSVVTVNVTDDGVGALVFTDGANGNELVGNINYTTGDITLTALIVSMGKNETFASVYLNGWSY
jgi:hypothetical protein